MASILEIQAMGSIIQRKSRGRVWNNDISDSRTVTKNKNKKVSKHEHINKNWDKDLWE